MSQKISAECPVPSVTFDEGAYSSRVIEYRQILFITGLIWGLYGILTVLAALSLRALMRSRTCKSRPTSIILCLTIVTLFASTTMYNVSYTLLNGSRLLKDYIKSGRTLWTTGNGARIEYPTKPLELVKDYSGLADCGCTAALTVNITLGDAIVCWRACTIWHNNRPVKTFCSLLVFATFVLGGIGTAKACHLVFRPENFRVSEWNGISFDAQLGTLYQGIASGVAASVLSLSTNLWATLLVGYKAWKSRRRLKGYLVSGSQTEKLFALLIESGAVYCTIWGLIMAYEIIQYRRWALGIPVSATESNFIEILTPTFICALVALVAIYPMVIIVFVALNRSHMDKGLLPEHLQSLPTPNIAITINTAFTRESRLSRRSEVLGIDLHERSSGCIDDGVEDSQCDTNTQTSKEWSKSDPMA